MNARTPTDPTSDRPSSDINKSYTYDHAGNVLAVAVADAPGSGAANRDIQCFQYDYLRRMTNAWSTANTAEKPCNGGAETSGVGGVAPYHHSYSYDDTGNRLTEKIHAVPGTTGVERTYTYPESGKNHPHGLDKVVERDADGNERLFTYEYDDAGNTSRRTKVGQDQVLDWGPEGHLASVTEAGKTTSFVYSADGERLVRKEPASTTLYLPGMELRVNTGSPTVEGTRFYPVAGGSVVVRTGRGTQFQVSDHHGTGQAAVDAQTGTLTMRRSTPFGADRGSQPGVGEWIGDKGFVGGTEDTATGLTHLGAREYDPATGRFVSVDPIIDVNDPQQMHGYAYSNNSPMTFSDPDGLKFCSDDNCGGGADYVDGNGDYHSVPGHNDGCGGCSGAKDSTANDGASVEPGPVKKAKEENERVKKELVAVAMQLGKILMDELGITDAVDCFTKGDIGGCAATALNIVLSLVGAAAGKLLARYWNKLDKLDDLGKALWRLGGRLKTLVGDFFKSRKKLDEAMEAAESCLTTGGPQSFVPGTLVLMEDRSTKPIEEVAAGDKVLATDPATGETVGKTVVATVTSESLKRLVRITVDTDGKAGEATGELVATSIHPFWVAGEQSWIKAKDLRAGQSLRLPDRTRVTIESVKRSTAVTRVHNFTVDDIHTYYVLAGDTPVLVHNDGGNEPISGTIARGSQGMTIQIYANDHGPPHAHLKGKGFDIQIGQNGKPLDSDVELNSRQQGFVDDNIGTIRGRIGAKMREYRLNGGGC